VTEKSLEGGVANAGAVVRVGDHVLRPAPPNVEAVHALLRHVRANGFDGVPEPLGIDADGRERLVYIDGDVPVPPYPEWAQADSALASIADLLLRFHAAAVGFAADGWNMEMADPLGGTVVGHNDVCLENVVFRDGEAVAFLDFEFAAPGRPVFDLATMVRMCGPLDQPEYASRLGWRDVDPFRRLRVAADGYGLDAGERADLLDAVDDGMARAGAFVAARVARGERPFIEMWERMGGQERYDRRRAWFAANRDRFAQALT
jgi:hypothetical protein